MSSANRFRLREQAEGSDNQHVNRDPTARILQLLSTSGDCLAHRVENLCVLSFSLSEILEVGS